MRGWQNRHSLKTAMENLQAAFPTYELVKVEGGQALKYTGSRANALEQWHGITDLLAKTTVISIVTSGIQHYVEGTQVGYSPVTRHLFKRGNTVKLLRNPMDPAWELNVSGYRILVCGKWSEIEKAHEQMGLNIFQMLQLRINEELEEALKREA